MKAQTKIKHFLKTLSTCLVLLFLFMNLEPAITDAATFSPQSGTITVNQVVSAEISITLTATVSMSPAISGISGGTGDGSATMTVITNNTNGFSMAVKADYSPAMTLGGANSAVPSFADYTKAGTPPDFAWSVAAADSEFGFTVEPETPANAVAAFLDNGTDTCGIGAAQTVNACWAPFTTTDYTVINRSAPTDNGGEAEVLKFKAQSGANHFQQQGTYTATITVTATTNP